MSTGAVAASQTTGTNALWNAGLAGYPPSPSQQPSNQTGKPPGSDRISVGAPGEAPPLLPMTASGDAKADSIVGSQVTGYAAIALLGAVIAIVAAALLPFIIEATNTRSKTIKDLKGEGFEHDIRQGHLEQTEPTVEWIRRLQKLQVNTYVTDRMADHYTVAFNDFAKAHDALKSATGGARVDAEARLAAAHEKVHKLGIPLRATGNGFTYDDRKIKQFVFDASAPASNGVPYEAALGAANHLYNVLVEKRAAGDLDSDDARLSDLQIREFVKRSIGIEPSDAEKFSNRVSRAEIRHTEFQSKLTELHHEALRKLALRPMGGVK